MEGNTASAFPGLDRDYYNVVGYPTSSGSPERRLLLAILERAILDYVGNDRKEITEAEEWLFGELEEPSYAIFSFSWVCEQLDLDMKEIASTIKAMPRRGNRKIAPWYFMKSIGAAQKEEQTQ